MILFLLAFIASLLGGFASPWWWPAIVGLALGLWKPEPRSVLFSATSCGAALAWGGVAAFYQIGNHGLLGGRIAEEVFLGQMTTGASNDFERATDLARAIRDRAVSAREVMQAHLDQIARHNPAVTAIVSLSTIIAPASLVASGLWENPSALKKAIDFLFCQPPVPTCRYR